MLNSWMSVRGSLATMPIADVLEWIDRRFVCGSLTVERAAVSRVFHFDSGYITSAGSNVAGERLGQVLMQRGAVTPEQLVEAFEVQADTGVALGKILLMVGAVSEDTLESALVDKIHYALGDAMSWSEGAFSFDPDDPSRAVSEYLVSVNLGDAVLRAAGQVQHRREIREVLPGDDVTFYVRDEEVLAMMEPELAEAIAGGHSARQMTLTRHGQWFDVMSELVDLVAAGAIGIERRRQHRGDESLSDPSVLEGAARGRANGGDRAGALELVASALESKPDDDEVRALFREIERSLFAELSRDLLSSFRVPKLLKSQEELASLELNEAERYLTGRIDGRWDLLSLLRVSPLREVEALITFKRLADRGIISI